MTRTIPITSSVAVRAEAAALQVPQVDRLPGPYLRYDWGKLGPEAITYFAREAGIIHHAAPIDVFYPVHYYQVSMLLDPDLSLTRSCTPRTLCIHLFDKALPER